MPRRRRAVLWVFAGGVMILFAAAVFWQRAELTPPRPSLMLNDRHGRFIAQFPSPDAPGYGYWPLSRVPPRVRAATLALEDQRFDRHPGVDLIAVARAAWSNTLAGRRVSGASTIAMQVARMRYPGARTWRAKLAEAATAVAMTVRHGRETVLRSYLRLAPYGNRSHGIAHAARWYFDQPVADLSWARIAFLAALPQSPSRYNPYRGRGRSLAKRRAEGLLKRLRDRGELSAAQLSQAVAELRRLRPVARRRDANALHVAMAIAGRIDRGGLLATSVDLDLQDTLADVLTEILPGLRRQGAGNAAVAVIDNRNREVLAWLGSADYTDSVNAGAIDYTAIRRSPGSTVKPFLYAAALDSGRMTPASALPDARWVAVGTRNADGRFLGMIRPRQALAASRNLPAVAVLRQLGVDRGYWLLEDLGLHRGRRPARYYGLGLAIGGMPTSLRKLVTAYGVFVDDGRLRPLRWLRGGSASEPGERIFSIATARIVSAWLADPHARLPTFARKGGTEFSRPVALKTGTSQGYRDSWALSWNRRYLVAAWVGRADARPMNGVSGATGAARIARAAFAALDKTRAQPKPEPAARPPGFHRVSVCANGAAEAGRCASGFNEWQADTALTTERPTELPVELSIVYPRDGQRLWRNPEMPAAEQILTLRARGGERIVWRVDGRSVGMGDSVDWPLSPGRHRIVARSLDNTARSTVTVHVF